MIIANWNVTVYSTIKETVFLKKEIRKNIEGCLGFSFSFCPVRHPPHHLPPQHPPPHGYLPPQHLPPEHLTPPHHHVVKAKQAHAHINLLREAGALSQLP